MTKKPHIIIRTSAVNEAALFFNSQEELSGFCRDISISNLHKPIFIIYKGNMFSNGPLAADVQVHQYNWQNMEALGGAEFRGFFKMIMDCYKEFRDSFSVHIPERNVPGPKPGENSNHSADALSYHVQGFEFKIATGNELEERVIDQLDPPALENALNEAVRRENFEAAAYIRDRIKFLKCEIIEDQDRLKVKYPAEAKGKDFKNLWYPSRD